MAKRFRKNGRQSFLRLCFVIYAAVMLWLLFGQRWGTEIYTQQLADRINLTPFATIGRYIDLLRNTQSAVLFRHATINLAGNVVMFIPLGFFLPKIWRRFSHFFRILLFALLLIVLVETVQYFTNLGTCDVDDLILNMAGVCIGYLFSKIKQR